MHACFTWFMMNIVLWLSGMFYVFVCYLKWAICRDLPRKINKYNYILQEIKQIDQICIFLCCIFLMNTNSLQRIKGEVICNIFNKSWTTLKKGGEKSCNICQLRHQIKLFTFFFFYNFKHATNNWGIILCRIVMLNVTSRPKQSTWDTIETQSMSNWIIVKVPKGSSVV